LFSNRRKLIGGKVKNAFPPRLSPFARQYICYITPTETFDVIYNLKSGLGRVW